MKAAMLIAVSRVMLACRTGEADEVNVRTDSATAEITHDHNHSMNRARNVEIYVDTHKRGPGGYREADRSRSINAARPRSPGTGSEIIQVGIDCMYSRNRFLSSNRCLKPEFAMSSG